MSGAAQAIIGVGANLPGADGTTPLQACRRALVAIAGQVGPLVAASSFYLSQPVPASAQPWFVNAVVVARTGLAAGEVLTRLQALEHEAGRRRLRRWEARVLDLDLLAFESQIITCGDHLILPHPRMAERAFVLVPLLEVAPAWRHPGDGRGVAEMLAALPPGQRIGRLP